jgi:hypothetical protein
MKNWEDMVQYYRNNPEARRNILKHAGLLNEGPMTEDRNDFPKEECYDPDEIIVRDIDTFFLECMSDTHIWIGITRKNGQIDHLNICVKGKKLSTLWTPNTGNMNPDARINNHTKKY